MTPYRGRTINQNPLGLPIKIHTQIARQVEFPTQSVCRHFGIFRSISPASRNGPSRDDRTPPPVLQSRVELRLGLQAKLQQTRQERTQHLTRRISWPVKRGTKRGDPLTSAPRRWTFNSRRQTKNNMGMSHNIGQAMIFLLGPQARNLF